MIRPGEFTADFEEGVEMPQLVKRLTARLLRNPQVFGETDVDLDSGSDLQEPSSWLKLCDSSRLRQTGAAEPAPREARRKAPGRRGARQRLRVVAVGLVGTQVQHHF